MIEKKFALLAAFTAMNLVTACGSISALGEDDGTSAAYESAWDEFAAARTSIGTRAATPIDEMPTNSTASYSGKSALSLNDSSSDESMQLLSDLSMDADFSTNKVEATLDNFVGEEGGSIDGSITLAGDVEANWLDATGSGQLSQGSETADLDLIMSGGFSGTDASSVAGNFRGTAVIGEDTRGVYGEYYAEE